MPLRDFPVRLQRVFYPMAFGHPAIEIGRIHPLFGIALRVYTSGENHIAGFGSIISSDIRVIVVIAFLFRLVVVGWRYDMDFMSKVPGLDVVAIDLTGHFGDVKRVGTDDIDNDGRIDLHAAFFQIIQRIRL